MNYGPDLQVLPLFACLYFEMLRHGLTSLWTLLSTQLAFVCLFLYLSLAVVERLVRPFIQYVCSGALSFVSRLGRLGLAARQLRTLQQSRSLGVFQSYFALPNQHDIPSTDHRLLAMLEYHMFAEQYSMEDTRRQSRLTVHH